MSTNEALFSFIKSSPTPFQAVTSIQEVLKQNGFLELSEEERWILSPGSSYYVSRNHSSLIAFHLPADIQPGCPCHIMASHCDSPSFKVKENPSMPSAGPYIRLNTERYGGMIYEAWMDRPLSIAGRVAAKGPGTSVRILPVNIDRDLVLIPHLAIHMDRKVNDGAVYKPQTDLLPLFSLEGKDSDFMGMIATAAGIPADDLLSYDLYLYNRQEGTVWGENKEFISSPRLDNMQCVFASMRGFLAAEKKEGLSLSCVFDNEEVGSSTRQGAASTFLYDTLQRINGCLGGSYEDYLISLAKGFMISADNAHALHPNRPDAADPVNRPVINGGIVIKYSGSQRYTSDAWSAGICKQICEKAGVPWQIYTNHSDILGGSTLGNISGNKVAIPCADIGLPMLAMHSPYETAGAMDTDYMIRFAQAFYV